LFIYRLLGRIRTIVYTPMLAAMYPEIAEYGYFNKLQIVF
jgi:hypothetical protein